MEKQGAFRHMVGLLSLWCCLGLGSKAWSQPIVTEVGTGEQGFAGDGGPATSARLNLPVSLWGDTSGVLYIADTGNHRIRRISAAGDTVATLAGTGIAGFSGDGGPATSARLNAPSGVCRDRLGNLYIADTDNHCIRKIVLATGLISTVAGSGTPGFRDTSVAAAAQFNFPIAVFADSAGNLFVADTGNHRIRKISTSGGVTTVAGTGIAGFSGDGDLATAARLNGPSGIFVDRDSAIYIADTGNHRIRKINPADSTIVTVAGTGAAGFSGDGGPATAARLAFPAAVWVDGDRTLYIADRFNHRLRRVNPAGDITTIAGDGSRGFAGDGGAANLAVLSDPSGLFVDGNGDLHLADTGNHRIRKISATDAIGPANLPLSNNGKIGPAGEVRLLGVSLTGDGSTAVQAMTFVLSDLTDSIATGLSQGDFAELRLYQSDDDTLDAEDRRIGVLDSSQILLGQPTTIRLSQPSVPGRGVQTRYLLSAAISRTAVQGHAFKLGFPTGGLATNKGGRGFRVAASDAHRIAIDAVATRLVFATQPGRALSGNPLLVQPVVKAVDDSGFVDFDFNRQVRLTTSGPGTLLHNIATADSGVATFVNLTYVAIQDDETFALVAEDVGGILPSVTSVSLRANAVNNPPTVDFPPLVLKEDDSLGFRTRLSVIVYDPDDPLSELEIAATSRHLQVQISSDSIIVVPEPDWFGIDTLTVVATDPFGLQGRDQARIEIQPVNDPPRFRPFPILSFAEDDTLHLDLREYVFDVDHPFAELSWNFVPSPGLFVHFDKASGQLDLWAPPEVWGQFSLDLQVRDPFFSTALNQFLVEIQAVNDPPRLALSDTAISQGEILRLNLGSHAFDPDHPLSQLSWSATSLTGLGVSTITLEPLGVVVVQFNPSFFGRDTLLFAATDPQGAVGRDTVVVEVLRLNQPPTLALLPDTTVAAGDTLIWDLRAYAADPDDPPDSLRWSVSGATRVQVSVTNGLLTFAAPPGPSYVENLSIRVADPAGRSATALLRVGVRSPLLPISGVPDVSFEAGQTFKLSLASYLSDPTSSVSAQAGPGLQVQIDPSSPIAAITSVGWWKGRAQIVFQAITSQGKVGTDTIQVEVLNPPPVLLGFPELSLQAGSSLQLALDNYVRDDEPLSALQWSAVSDAGLQVDIDPSLHLATLAASPDASGPLKVLFTVADAQQAKATDTLRVLVRAVPPDTSDTGGKEENRAPVIAPLPSFAFYRNLVPQLDLDQYVEDDGPLGDLVWSATAEPGGLVRVEISAEHLATFIALQDTGRALIRFRATDAYGLSAIGELQVTLLSPTSPLRGDFNRNGKIDFDDFFLLVDALGLNALHPDWNPVLDLDQNGMISFDDFFQFADLFQSFNRFSRP